MSRRMFSDKITSSDAFLDMPTEVQNLYFHLSMNADDDGFIGNPKTIMRIIGSGDDSYKLLLAKKFVIHFESGICVIKHWRINNFIRKDIYKETKYLREKSNLFIRENGSYTLNPENSMPLPRGHFTVNETLTKRQLSIGKVSIDKISKEDINKKFEEFWSLYPRKVAKPKAKQSFEKILSKYVAERENVFKDIIDGLNKYKTCSQWTKDDGQFIPHPTTWLNQERWNDEVGSKTFSTGGSSDKFKNIGKKV